MPGTRSRTAFRGVTGQMPGRLPAPDGGCSHMTLDLAPGDRRASVRGGLTLPKLGAAVGPARSRSFAAPGGLTVQDRPERAPDPSRARDRGGKPKRAVPVVSSSGEWRRPEAGARVAGAARRGTARKRYLGRAGAGGQGTGGGPAVRAPVPVRPAARSRSAMGKAPARSGRGLRPAPRRAAPRDPHPTANPSHPPQPAACRNPPFRFFNPVTGALTGPEPAQGGLEQARHPSRDQQAREKQPPDRAPALYEPLCCGCPAGVNGQAPLCGKTWPQAGKASQGQAPSRNGGQVQNSHNHCGRARLRLSRPVAANAARPS